MNFFYTSSTWMILFFFLLWFFVFIISTLISKKYPFAPKSGWRAVWGGVSGLSGFGALIVFVALMWFLVMYVLDVGPFISIPGASNVSPSEVPLPKNSFLSASDKEGSKAEGSSMPKAVSLERCPWGSEGRIWWWGWL